MGNKPHKFCIYSPEPRTEVYCLTLARHMRIRTAGTQFMRDNPERFIESNTESSWLRYLNNMCIQGTWADLFIIQAVADALNVTIQIVESNQGFAPLTTV